MAGNPAPASVKRQAQTWTPTEAVCVFAAWFIANATDDAAGEVVMDAAVEFLQSLDLPVPDLVRLSSTEATVAFSGRPSRDVH